jgi:valyl-tRNA synthetase
MKKEILDKPYNPNENESLIYQKWENSGFFNPDVCIEKGLVDKSAPSFSMVLPPPTVTGTLHIGHAFESSLQDIAVRYHRMKGFKTLWIPGTDHAAIATQSKVEKNLEKESGKRKTDFSREDFLKIVDDFAKQSHDTIVNQVKKVGDSLDWSREAFTLDDERNLAVRTVFKKMYDDGIIYQGEKIVNWDPKGQTVISDDEIVYSEEKTKLYYLKYGPFTIATSRPETKFGDKYVVMHPEDKRYSEYKHNDQIELEWINGKITATVIKDDCIDMEFGTGVMTITPWHDKTDFEISERHNLSKEQIIDKYGKLLEVAGEFSGMKIKDAREKIINKLRDKGLLLKEEDYVHNIGTAERSGGVIEPQIMKQWFVSVNKEFSYPFDTFEGIKKGQTVTLKTLMRHAVSSGQVKIIPERFEKIYFHWIDNLHDWCISRQLWYGHRIPVWYKENQIYCDIEAPKEAGWVQDEDTLDTWFSSALWTFSTLGWPKSTKDLLDYHPTSLMAPGYEILFFWVARMILMTTYNIGQIPFKTVYIHGIVRDKDGEKFSKSKGNGIDPLDVIKEYGADALRMALTVSVGPGNDSKFDIQKVKAYKLFANKLWNICRFVSQYETNNKISKDLLTEKDKELVDSFDAFVKEITSEMNEYKFYLVSEKIYSYTWHTFADKIIEESKEIILDPQTKDSRVYALNYITSNILKILHPFMPFITEKLWEIMEYGDNMLMVSKWPSVE